MTAASLRFRRVGEEDLDNVFNDRFLLEQLGYSLSISTRDSWLGLHSRQLSRDRKLQISHFKSPFFCLLRP